MISYNSDSSRAYLEQLAIGAGMYVYILQITHLPGQNSKFQNKSHRCVYMALAFIL